MVQVNLGQLLDLLLVLASEFLDYEEQIILLELKVVNEDLEEVLDFDLLVVLEGVLVLEHFEPTVVLRVVNQRFGDVFHDGKNFLSLL